MSKVTDVSNSVYKGIKRNAIIGIAALVLLGPTSVHKTGTTEVGVRTKKVALFGEAGVQKEPFAPGSTYFFLPVLNDWDTYDTKLVNIEMSQKSPDGDTELLFKTIDGNDIGLDVIFSYRIDPKKASFIRKYVAKDDKTLEYKVVAPICRARSRDVFGELTTEQFYNAEERGKAATKAQVEVLQPILEKYGVILEKVDPKDYRFNTEYAAAVADKKKAEIETMKLQSEQNATLERNQSILSEADSTVNKVKANADGAYSGAVISADAYYDQQKNIANAIIAEGKAQAASIIKSRQAMIAGGGATYVKMKIAEALQGKEIIMVPAGEAGSMNIQTFDLNKFMQVYGTTKIAEEKK